MSVSMATILSQVKFNTMFFVAMQQAISLSIKLLDMSLHELQVMPPSVYICDA